MKIRRYRKVNRYLNFYANNFGFRQPYQILVDGTFCLAALNNKINIADNIPKYLQSELKLLTTQCAIIETESFGYKLQGTLVILKQYALHKCGHEKKPLSGAKCFLSMIGKFNEKHYIIATQDRDLQKKLETIPGVPLLYLHSKAPILSPPGKVSLEASQECIRNRVGFLPSDKVVMNKLENENKLQENERKQRKRKGPRGPNPLSCKKKKRKINESQVVNKVSKDKDSNNDSQQKRKKIRVAKHIKQLLKT